MLRGAFVVFSTLASAEEVERVRSVCPVDCSLAPCTCDTDSFLGLQNSEDGPKIDTGSAGAISTTPASCGVTGSETVRIAVVFYGVFRPSGRSLPSIQANLLKPLHDVGAVDVFIHALVAPADMTKRNSNYGTTLDPNEFKLFDPCVSQAEVQADVDSIEKLLDKMNSTTHPVCDYDSTTALNVWRSRYSMGRAADLVRVREVEAGPTIPKTQGIGRATWDLLGPVLRRLWASLWGLNA